MTVSCAQLVQQPDTALLGVILLQTVSEELAAPREDLSMARREELHRLLLQQVPTILQLLNSMWCLCMPLFCVAVLVVLMWEDVSGL